MPDPSQHPLVTNASLVLADRVIEHGWLAVRDGRIAEVGEGRPPDHGIDLQGDLLIPGLVELHTDHLEAHYMPRPKVQWDPLAAVVSCDAQLAASGITTVLDAIRVSGEEALEATSGHHEALTEAIAAAVATGLLRAEHFLHLRCELPTPALMEGVEKLAGRHVVRLISMMDHTPGQRQYRDPEKHWTYYRGKNTKLTDAELKMQFEVQRRHHRTYAQENRHRLIAVARARRIPLASHDDTLMIHVEEAIRDGVAIAEFPTTMEAAGALHDAGIRVVMGAPNLMLGGSHAGNIATADLADAGILDAMSSDYVPASLLPAALQLPNRHPRLDLAAAIRTVTKTPADAVGLTDRGEIAVGKRADLVRVHCRAAVPVIRAVWREGHRVA